MGDKLILWVFDGVIKNFVSAVPPIVQNNQEIFTRSLENQKRVKDH